MKWVRLWAILAIIGATVPAVAQSPTGTPDYRQLSPVGTILLWAGNYTPPGWLALDGSCISVTDYPELYALIGYSFSPGHMCNPPTTFPLPDLRNRVPVGEGQNVYNPSNRIFGSYGGREVMSLTVTEMPAHTHSYGWITSNTPGGAISGTGRYITGLTTGTTGSTGAGAQFSLMNPFVVVRYIINAGKQTLVLPPTATAVPTSTPAPTATPQPTSTPAPTATPQPTWTLGPGNMISTPIPEIVLYTTMEANGNYQAVAFEYSMTAGDMMVSVLLLFTCGLLALGMVMRARGDKA